MPTLWGFSSTATSRVFGTKSSSGSSKPTDPWFAIDDGAGQWAVPGRLGPHDVGGVNDFAGVVVDTAEPPIKFWERRMHALLVLLISKRIISTDELRVGIEQLHPQQYAAFTYYEKWAVSVASALLQRHIIDEHELDRALGHDGGNNAEKMAPLYSPGDAVQVKKGRFDSRWRKPHLRTPGYVFGAEGTIVEYRGAFGDPEFLAFRGLPHTQHLYTVRFPHHQLWPEYTGSAAAAANDSVALEVYESWLQPGTGASKQKEQEQALYAKYGDAEHDHHHDHNHDHHHDHDHDHLPRHEVEEAAVADEGPERPGERVAEALLALLADKGIADASEVRAAMERLDASQAKQPVGAAMVARAWKDDDFRRLLLKDAVAAAAEMGIVATNSTAPTLLRCVESTPEVHNLIVCTLCSCYPISVLGLSPPWYKSREFRSRAVREPRALLADSFGLTLPQATEVRVWDSTADMRYMVLPARPEGTDGWAEEELRALVTRDSIIGVAQCTVE